ncbi:MAG: primosomal protein N' [Coxiellaceae bacterium]|jgi:primosomal protein N' (replication factor Y)|nr:primosomal protein N' [Coxiellaceae bacterium]
MSSVAEKFYILRVAVPSPLRNLFDYLLPENSNPKDIQPGMRVLVPFGSRELIGVVLEVATHSRFAPKLRRAIVILDSKSLLSSNILNLINWTSNYYHHPVGEVINNVLPKLLRQKARQKQEVSFSYDFKDCPKSNSSSIKLNEYQKRTINIISSCLDKFKTFLLDGVTGSGKTEVYLRVISEIIALDKQALILIPEINLTPQTIAHFTKRFRVTIMAFHSRLTPKERLASWQMAKNGVAPIVIGTRSAIFTPLKNPGIIIVDEEHDLSFKQQSGLRYSARDLAVVRGKLENIPVILGSATPSLESIYNVRQQRYLRLTLPERAGGAIHPSFHLVDMRNQKLQNGIAENLLRKIKEHLGNGGQVLIFLNRRGFAPILICNCCGWVAECKYCDARLTIHKKSHHLCCHHCGSVVHIPSKCPKCSEEKLLMLGYGTERITLALQELFPEIKLIRIDRDTTKRKNSLEEILENIHAEKYRILIGTQMLTKGHHFPKVTMAAVLNVDQSLFSSDFRASEHLAQLIIQVAGRAGRAKMPGEVYLQTHNPHNPLLLNLINGGYMSFVNNCLEERQIAELPPYTYLALLQAESKKEDVVFEYLNLLRATARIKIHNVVKIFGPVSATMERKAGYFRAQLLLQSKNRDKLQQALNDFLQIIAKLKSPRNLRWFLDVDPVEL